MTTEEPFGSWPSPVTTELIVSGAAALVDTAADQGVVYWAEQRPDDGARVEVVARRPDGSLSDLVGPGFSVRTRVHEYGGGAFTVADGVLYFANWADQRLYRRTPDGAIDAISLEPPDEHGWRFADGRVTLDGAWFVCVREDHTGVSTGQRSEPRNEIVALSLTEIGTTVVLATGRDFVAAPRIRPDGSKLAWLTWDHPNMPWDSTELWTAELVSGDGTIAAERAHRTAGVEGESLVQPEWNDAGTLFVVSDRDEWWNVYRVDAVDVLEPVAPTEAEIGEPAWSLGQSRYVFVGDEVVATYSVGATAMVVRAGAAGVTRRATEFCSLGALRADGDGIVAIASSTTAEPVVIRIDLGDTGDGSAVLRAARDLGLDPDLISVAEPIDFPSANGRIAHAYVYAPTNPEVVGTPGSKPPLLVLSHGGPTGSTSSAFRLAIQFWTSRGFIVADVDYGGSTGYGRTYRRLLDGQWGIVDVEDCCAVAEYLVAQGRADPRRLAIRGGSAGGFTTLAALAFRDVFGAGCNMYGVADLAALARDTHKFEARYLDGLVGPYPEAAELYERRSPLQNAHLLSCPIITLQGLDDKIVPPNQSEMLVAALAAKGIPHTYLAFEGEQHGFRQASTIVAALNAELSFYGKVFGFTPAGNIEAVAIEFEDALDAPKS